MTFMASHEKVAYVAAVRSSANIAQCLRAFQEAEAFPGPAVVVAYSPCIEHGIEGPPGSWTAQARACGGQRVLAALPLGPAQGQAAA